jgi:hypothetical protein
MPDRFQKYMRALPGLSITMIIEDACGGPSPPPHPTIYAHWGSYVGSDFHCAVYPGGGHSGNHFLGRASKTKTNVGLGTVPVLAKDET